MAESERIAEETIRKVSKAVFYEVIKLMYFADTNGYRKSINSINNLLYDVQDITLKPNNARIKASDYYEWIYGAPNDNGIDGLISVIKRRLADYEDLKTLMTYEELYEKLEVLYKKLSVDLHKDTFQTIEDYLNV